MLPVVRAVLAILVLCLSNASFAAGYRLETWAGGLKLPWSIAFLPDGSALEIPPHSVIVGSTHLLNVSAAPLHTMMTMDVETVPVDQVDVRLTPFSFAIGDLKIPPAVDGVPTESRTAMTCDLREPFLEHLQKDVVDYNIYYVLGHYHQWGNFFNLSFVQEDGTRQTVFEIKNRI